MDGRANRRTILIVVLAGALLLPAVFMAFALWSMNAHGVPETKLAKLSPGMSSGDVQALLGKPGSIHEHSGDTYSWTYSRMTWCMVQVRFSPDGEVSEIVHDH